MTIRNKQKCRKGSGHSEQQGQRQKQNKTKQNSSWGVLESTSNLIVTKVLNVPMQVVGDHTRQVGGGLMKEGARCHIKKLRFYSVNNNHVFPHIYFTI